MTCEDRQEITVTERESGKIIAGQYSCRALIKKIIAKTPTYRLGSVQL